MSPIFKKLILIFSCFYCQYSWALTIREIPDVYETPTPLIYENVEHDLWFVEISPDIDLIIEETKYDESGLYTINDDSEKIYGFDNYGSVYAISSDGRYFVTANPANTSDVRYNIKEKDLNKRRNIRFQAYLNFFKDGEIIKQYHLQELVSDTSRISLTFDRFDYYWINKTKTDYELGHIYVETVDNNLYVFDMKTGEILASSIYNPDKIESDESPGKYQKLSEKQLNFYKNGDSVTPWKKLNLDNLNYSIIDYVFLTLAIEKGDILTVRDMVESGADINFASTRDKKSPIHIAVQNNNYELTDYLIKNGADLNNKYHNNITPLYIAVDTLYKETFPRLRNKRKYKNEEDRNKAIEENKKIIILLIDSGAETNITAGRHNYSILYLMVSVSDPEIVQLLLSKGADPNTIQKNIQKTALHLAIEKDNAEIAKLLLSHGADPYIFDRLGKAPLHYSVSPDTAEVLLEAGVDPDFKDKSNSTLLDRLTANYTNKRDDEKINSTIETLLKHGANSELTVKGRYSAFENSLIRDNVVQAKLFMNYGADVNAFINNGNLPIHRAALSSTDMLNAMLEAGAEPNKKNNAGRTALQNLCFTGTSKLPDKPGPGIPEESFNAQIKSMEDKCNNIKILEKLDVDPDATIAFCEKEYERRPPNWISIYTYCKQEFINF